MGHLHPGAGNGDGSSDKGKAVPLSMVRWQQPPYRFPWSVEPPDTALPVLPLVLLLPPLSPGEGRDAAPAAHATKVPAPRPSRNRLAASAPIARCNCLRAARQRRIMEPHSGPRSPQAHANARAPRICYDLSRTYMEMC